MQFDHERLRVYQEAIAFVAWVSGLLQRLPRKIGAAGHLDESSTSIALSIAEGNGKFTPRDRCHYFDISRGSALECAACLDVLVARGVCSPSEIEPGKEMLVGIVSMLVGLIKSNDANRVYEPRAEYGVGSEPGS